MVLLRQFRTASLKTPYQIRLMEHASQGLYRLFRFLESFMKPGSSGQVLEKATRVFAKQEGFELPLIDFEGFPSALCVSFGGLVAHGIPSPRPFEVGDMVIVDTVLSHKGWCADASWTWIIGPATPAQVEFLHHALAASLAAARASDQGLVAMAQAAHQELAEQGTILPGFTGHGIGRGVHELPRIPLVVPKKMAESRTNAIPVGTVFTVEPVIAQGDHDQILTNADGSFSIHGTQTVAQFEVMVAMEAQGPRILGLPPSSWDQLLVKPRFT